MTPAISPNTQAILLLTAPLIAGRGAPSTDLLSPGEYKRLARHLREMQCQPADLLSPDAAELLRACQPVIEQSRLQHLLGRGFLLSQVVERWQTRAIWVVSRADTEYPRRLKARLREDAPAVLYGCGELSLLESSGLAVVGSRHVDDALIEYTMAVGHLAARAGRPLVSGGAKGIDQAAMRGALEGGGKASGVLADSLEKTAMNREHRNLLIDGKLVLISPYDPNAGFNVGNAMQRNKLIYALADAALVVSSDFGKGGTWAGATEQLDKLRLIPVYVRSTGETSRGLDALRSKGAVPWPNPHDVDSFEAVFNATVSTVPATTPLLFSASSIDDSPASALDQAPIEDLAATSLLGGKSPPTQPIAAAPDDLEAPPTPKELPSVAPEGEVKPDPMRTTAEVQLSPADALYAAAREAIERLLQTPMNDAEVATALDVSKAQAKIWLERLVREDVVEKRKKPPGYLVKQSRLF